MKNKSVKTLGPKHLILIIFAGCLCLSNWGTYTLFQNNDSGNLRMTSLSVSKPKTKKSPDKEVSVLLRDPAIKKNWGLMGTGGVSDILASKAWKISRGDKNKIIAIIDTGADIRHPDLKNNLWTNKKEIPNNGIDDDKNGFIDDIHGWNFTGKNNNLKDNHGHGTHIAGIVGAEGGNGVGISGVTPQASLMILKYYDPKAKGNNNLKNTIEAINYAIDNGATIINYSGGGLEYSHEEYKAIKRAKDKGILFVAAAGNEKSNSDKKPYYPANYKLDNIISVTAINSSAKVLKSSNWGKNTVHIAAPGEDIFSTLPSGKYGTMTGTSQATAFVTGVAALLMSTNKDFNYLKVRKRILSTSDELPGMHQKIQTAGKLNSWAALAMKSNSAISDIEITANQTTPRYTLENRTTQENSQATGINGLSAFRNLLGRQLRVQ